MRRLPFRGNHPGYSTLRGLEITIVFGWGAQGNKRRNEHLQPSFVWEAKMDGRGNYRTEDLLLFRRIFDECLRGLPTDKRTAIHRARIAKQLLDCAATGERNPEELRVAATADIKQVA
jgi:hypothetical protein